MRIPLIGPLFCSLLACSAFPMHGSAATRLDFDGDGRSDLLWRNVVTGKVVAWRAGNPAAPLVLGHAPGSGWQIAATGVMSTPYFTDLVWRDDATGALQVWPAGLALEALPVVVRDAAADPINYPDWDLLGIGDFNRASAQWLLRHRLGQVAMARPNFVDGAVVQLQLPGTCGCDPTPTSPSLDWIVAAIGNSSNSIAGDPIYWRNSTTGAVARWVYSSFDGGWYRDALGRVNPSWVIAGEGDFDGDGNSDLLWRQPITGANAIWPNGNPSSARRLASARPVWRVASILDLDGDAQADIVWRNPNTGGNVVWRSGEGATAMAMTSVTNPAWQIVP